MNHAELGLTVCSEPCAYSSRFQFFVSVVQDLRVPLMSDVCCRVPFVFMFHVTNSFGNMQFHGQNLKCVFILICIFSRSQ
jgi:hypothetical protein